MTELEAVLSDLLLTLMRRVAELEAEAKSDAPPHDDCPDYYGF